MTARFKIDIERRAPVLRTRILDSHGLSVQFAGALVIPPAYDPAVLHHDNPDHGIGACDPHPLLRQSQGHLHVDLVWGHGLRAAISYFESRPGPQRTVQ